MAIQYFQRVNSSPQILNPTVLCHFRQSIMGPMAPVSMLGGDGAPMGGRSVLRMPTFRLSRGRMGRQDGRAEGEGILVLGAREHGIRDRGPANPQKADMPHQLGENG